MHELVFVALAGFAASFVDGALGMGFGPTSSTILLGAGLSPATTSTTVNLAKVATGLAAAVSHWRFRNIDHRLVIRLAVAGSLGAVIGVTVLANIDGKTLRPILSSMLVVVGLRILLRFSRPLPDADTPREGVDDYAHDPPSVPAFDQRGTGLVAAAGGVTNGLIGAWGPVVTPFLLQRGLRPRFAVGSVNTAEVAVAAVSAGSLLGALGGGGLDLGVILAMLGGGIVAAPVAALAIRFIPARAMGLAVGGLLLLTNARELADWASLASTRWVLYALIAVLVGLAALAPRWAVRAAGHTP
ncbi:sulfite exporter TauE/SafE family protein [Rhabdothermincola sediminis]|uniref:sulfite exporter TauE/SafE family protein n=1 Tax=Rhabdothermincola sediminis TaxID=2751370 RepID=UPI001AA0A794|nr:sulfite exporter TauE/SafE family protein [Rhabdothermincola sediminis]